ncbi:MAG: hypothetical protein M3174_08090 [Actinomycetota bacterium]|nr:hypothetical protein [Actinomycetota bacterium]
MYIRRLRSTPLWLFALAFAGVVAGHSLAFFLEAPHHHHREELLEATGHGNWWIAIALGLALFLASLALFVGRRVASSRQGRRGFVRRVTYRMAPLQIGAFILLEALERWGARDLSGLLGERVILIGVVVQVAVAAVAALLLLLVARVVGALIEKLRRPAAVESKTIAFGSQVDSLPGWFFFCARDVRGPPLRRV